ncbi:MAG: hypothetical protein IJW31_04965 [Lentisphaeria bacterium]|nr:hypothetical protein [Lentisphaeria bacterium]
MRKYAEFTLVEMLAVVAITAIVIALSIGGYNMAMKSSREAATKSTILKLELVLNELHKKYGIFPPEVSGAGIPNGYAYNNSSNRYFIIDLDDRSINGYTHLNNHSLARYISDFVKMIDLEDMNVLREDNCYTLLDGWDQPLVYRTHANKINQGAFDIISAGNDLIFNIADIATEKGGDLDYDIDDFPEAIDDITNFNLDK